MITFLKNGELRLNCGSHLYHRDADGNPLLQQWQRVLRRPDLIRVKLSLDHHTGLLQTIHIVLNYLVLLVLKKAKSFRSFGKISKTGNDKC